MWLRELCLPWKCCDEDHELRRKELALIVAIHQPQYLAWLPYIDKADSCDTFVYLDTAQYQKNGVQNRNQIKTATGAMWLTVPVHAHLENSIAETRIADERWAEKHLRAVELNYSRSAFYESYAEELGGILSREWSRLGELNIEISEWMFRCLEIHRKTVRASSLQVSGKGDELILNICKALGGDVYFSGQGARAYQKPEKFRERGIELRYQNYRNLPYAQCHGGIGFIPDLSAIDAILNLGKGARELMLAGRMPPEAG